MSTKWPPAQRVSRPDIQARARRVYKVILALCLWKARREQFPLTATDAEMVQHGARSDAIRDHLIGLTRRQVKYDMETLRAQGYIFSEQCRGVPERYTVHWPLGAVGKIKEMRNT